ncbi:hypothetical protein [Spirillospora sp. NPDC047279]|uniref:hypothetical protein n=1 Tax=Spirillospora sp. NPDC047279 TaxID=3155478 RepID=UPI0033D64677
MHSDTLIIVGFMGGATVLFFVCALATQRFVVRDRPDDREPRGPGLALRYLFADLHSNPNNGILQNVVFVCVPAAFVAALVIPPSLHTVIAPVDRSAWMLLDLLYFVAIWPGVIIYRRLRYGVPDEKKPRWLLNDPRIRAAGPVDGGQRPPS